MNASEVLKALRTHYSPAALVHEVALNDAGWTGDVTVPSQRRIDALMFRSLERTAIEIKVSRADFNRECERKWLPWARVTHRFLYAVPEGLIEPSEMWEFGNVSAGLVYVSANGRVRSVKNCKPNKHPEPLPQHVVQALAYRAANMQRNEEAQ